ncbi:hypothetical protein HELRODRAFT_75099 [Helobdella robusta]|uniref:Uncharacterized protein n=1 Tax=Helobdella robusta TaxID=6412 RepID=T1G206_HELRO|nr:hypothetical protein HELRODRAFT_75099 [Helobdella robusta]ESO07866.1 hypothetical protein HELRODRAFT_75099 [Helobdella robusta]
MIDARTSKDVAGIPRGVGTQPRFLHASAIKLHKLQFGIDKRLTIIDEKSNAVLKYRTPHFRALATVEIPPLPAGVNIQVGWIQVCTDMQFINTYGNEGLTSWEFPEIVSGKYKMVSDADGKQYPWYGSKNEVAHLQGPTQNPTTATIHMNDNFFPQVTWYIPSIGYTRDPSLSFVYRKQRFYTFLALKDVNTDTYQIIRTLTWSMELAIDVNPKNPLGKRAKLLGPFEQESPKVVPEHLTPPLKSYALNPPNANSCQVLVWRPKYGDTELVVPPVQTTMEMSRYLVSTRDATAKLLRITKSNFLLKAQQQQK